MRQTSSSATRRSAALVSTGMALLGGQLVGLAAADAEADPAPVETPEVTAADDPDVDVIAVQDLAPDGAVVSEAAYDASGRQVILRPDGTVAGLAAHKGSGDGGESSAAGCRKVTVYNKGKSILGDVVYSYNTWTEWCWDRSDHAVTSAITGQFFSQVASTMYYRGLELNDQRSYAWQSGYNKSGHWHERQSHWENCVAKYGCISSDYPRNVLRAHSDGTYTWATHD